MMLYRAKTGIAGLSLLVQGKSIALVGLGRSHSPLVKLFDALAATTITARDQNPAPRPELAAQGAKLMLGEGYLDDLSEDIILRTPAVRGDLPALTAARERGALVTSEMELFLAFCPCPCYGITGSDGKTTTSTLVAGLLEAAGKRVYLGGNIGDPMLPRLTQMTEDDRAVAELSSFQLMGMSVSPEVALITNLSENHLDWHLDMDEYIEAKTAIFEHQQTGDLAVFNADNDYTRALAARAPARVRYFSRTQTVENGAYCINDALRFCADGVCTPLFSREEILVPGAHNLENYLAAIAACYDDIRPSDALNVARSFTGVAHRMELVAVVDGVRYYNSSIDSTPVRSAATLTAFKTPPVVLCGGYDKHLNYAPMAPLLTEHAKAVVLCGQTAEKIKAALNAYGAFAEKKIPLYVAESFEEAFSAAVGFAESGDSVVLSPASASFDLFRDYEERGEVFRRLVRALERPHD